jgi:hypothetical protein
MLNASVSAQRVIMRIELLPQAKGRFIDYCQGVGISQVAAASRLIQWFSEQDDVVQAASWAFIPKIYSTKYRRCF